MFLLMQDNICYGVFGTKKKGLKIVDELELSNHSFIECELNTPIIEIAEKIKMTFFSNEINSATTTLTSKNGGTFLVQVFEEK